MLRSFVLSLMLGSSAQACDLALALAVDVSGSVDPQEYNTQMVGLAEALRDPIISEALVRADARLMLVQWTGSMRQKVTIPWTRIDGFDALDRFAVGVATDPRVWRNYSTAIGEALSFTADLFTDVRACKRLLIDLSGDGMSNEGALPTEARTHLAAMGITVNAIAIEESEEELTTYFFENVIFGEGAFVETASGFQDYPERIRRKLLREVVIQSAQLNEAAASEF